MDAPPPSLLPSSLPIESPILDFSSLNISSDASQPCLQPFPVLANELKKEILRFCDPSTLANTSLVSLAFLELSTPFLYYEVETHGCEQLSLLFKPRTLPSLLPSSTGSSLPPIRIFDFTQVTGDSYDLLLSIPTQPALRLRRLVLRLNIEPLALRTLYRLCHPKHLVVQAAHREDPKSSLVDDTKFINLSDAFWSRLQTIKFVGPACVGFRKLRKLATINFPRLRLVTYDLLDLGRPRALDWMQPVIVDLAAPLPEVVQVVVLVSWKWERKLFRELLEDCVDAGVKGQIKVKVRAS